MKYLLLKFQSAKLFYNSYKTKDYIIDYTLEEEKIRRENSYCFKEPLTKYQISNMLHVMFGERPSATLRKTVIEKNEYLFNKAQNSYLYIISAKTFNKNKNENVLIKEKTSLKKMAYNSYANPAINWEIVKNYLDIHYNECINLLAIILNHNPLNKTFDEIKYDIFKLKDNDIITDLFIFLKEVKCTGLYNVFINEDDSANSLICRKQNSLITICNGIDDIVNLSGDILVPINDEDIIKLNNFKGTCNILDGGFVYIEKIIHENDINIEYFNKFVKVGDISVETINYKK